MFLLGSLGCAKRGLGALIAHWARPKGQHRAIEHKDGCKAGLLGRKTLSEL